MEDVRRLPVGEDNEGRVTLDGLAREGARRMIAAALEAQARSLGAIVDVLDDAGDQAGALRVLAVGPVHLEERLPGVAIGRLALVQLLVDLGGEGEIVQAILGQA